MLGDVQDERGFAHTGPGGDQNQVGALKPAGQFIQIGKAGGQAGDAAFGLVHFIDLVERAEDDFLDRLEVLARLARRHFEDLLLGGVQHPIHFLRLGITHGGDIGRRADQAAQQAFFLYDLGVVGDVRRRRHAIGQRGDVGDAACLLQGIVPT